MNTVRTTLPVRGFWDTRQGGRAENQDSCGFVDTPYGLIAIVCDGMGGGPAGKQASVLAVQAVAEYVSKASNEETLEGIISNAVEHAHQVIVSEGEEHPEMKGMGSTIAAVLFNAEAAIVAHVGDSRVYQFRRGQEVFRTQDHSDVADRVRNGELTEEKAKLTGQTNLITRALGGKGDHLADVKALAYEEGDRFLLCTDGIWGMLTEKELTKRAAQTPSLAGAVDSIVLQVDEIGRNNGNRHDNLTLALFETKTDSKKKVEMNRKAIFIIRTLAVICCISLLANLVLLVNALRPNAEKKLLEKSELRIAEQENNISQLNNKVDSLQSELVKATKEAADALMEAAAEKTKAAEKAEQEAKKKAEEAQKAAEKAQEAAAKSQKISKEITAIVKILRDASNQKGNNRNKYIKQAQDALGYLSKIDVAHKAIYDYVKTKLNDSITQSNSDKAKGHFNSLIKELEKIKL